MFLKIFHMNEEYEMSTLLRPAFSLLIVLSLLTGIAYPVLVSAIAQIVAPRAAAGSLIIDDKKIIGSTLIGQNFSDPKYFWGRLSATAPQPYSALASSGSNLGPLNPALIDQARARIAALQAADSDLALHRNNAPIPVDLVTASASGLDPHISPAAANYQIDRVAHARHLDHNAVANIVAAHTEGRQFGLFGEPRVNVLELNLALDRLEK